MIIREAVCKFVEYIVSFEKALQKHFEIDTLPYFEAGRGIPRQGMLLVKGIELQFRFHGAGCTFEHEDLVIDYDMDFSSANRIVVSTWKLLRSLNSLSLEFAKMNLTEMGLLDHLRSLENSGLLIPLGRGIGNYRIVEDKIRELTDN